MSPPALRSLLVCLALGGLTAMARGGMASYTDRGKTDFDTVLQLLNPYGAWSKIAGKWAFTPTDHLAPYTDGRWIYTEYGWYWKGRLPHSWATEHYGYWKRGANKLWSWYPGAFWLPQTVEIRATSKYIGWRSAEVDGDGNFVEPPIDRFSKFDEWTFVTLEQFANPITPAIIAPPNIAKSQLEISTESFHTYLTYREIDRPGPHPADLTALCRDGGMLSPDFVSSNASSPPPVYSTTNSPPTNSSGTTAPELLGTEITPGVDTRQVKYWITMSLPTFWTSPPADAKPNEIYLYRPDFFQDDDGIARRITLWFHPSERTTLADLLGNSKPAKTRGDAAPGIAASPALPAGPDQSPAHDPFRSPLDEPYQPGIDSRPPSSSSKNPVPSGLSSDTPVPLPTTNAAPATHHP